MTKFALPFRLPPQLRWIAIVLCAVAAIEAGVAMFGPATGDDRNNFFEYRFGHVEIADRVFITQKLKLFSDEEPTIIQVGDSSGFHGVIPPVVEAIIPGVRYVNMNVFASLGYGGFLEVARYMLDRSTKTKVLVLYVSPAGFQPNDFSLDERERLGGDIWREFNSPWQRFFHIPSLVLRRDVTGLLYGGGAPSPATRDAVATARYPEAFDLMRQTGGWTRERDTPGDISTGALEMLRSIVGASKSDDEVLRDGGATYGVSPMTFDWMRLRKVSVAEQTFDKFRALAAAHGVKLVIASAPMFDSARSGPVGRQLDQWRETLRDYQDKHPEVGVVPMVFYPDRLLSSPVHVAAPYTLQNTVRFATALKEAIGPGTLAAIEPRKPAPRPVTHDIEMTANAPVYGFADPVQEGATTYRAIRQGRSEGLVYARLPAGADRIEIDVAPDTPQALRRAASVSFFGERAERIEDPRGNGRRLAWRIPDGAFRYGGWVEILVSTRGLAEWPGDELRDDADGPSLRISAIRIRNGDLAAR